MNPIRIVQKGLEEATAKQIEVSAAISQYFHIIASEKEHYVRKQLLDKEFLCEDLLEPGKSTYDWKYEDYEGHIYKTVATDITVDEWEARNPYGGGKRRPFSLEIAFLRNPDEILNSKMKLTDGEIKILKNLQKSYERKYGHADYGHLKQAQYDLRKLKHKINLLITIYWSFTFEEITEEDFLEHGLRAQSRLI